MCTQFSRRTLRRVQEDMQGLVATSAVHGPLEFPYKMRQALVPSICVRSFIPMSSSASSFTSYLRKHSSGLPTSVGQEPRKSEVLSLLCVRVVSLDKYNSGRHATPLLWRPDEDEGYLVILHVNYPVYFLPLSWNSSSSRHYEHNTPFLWPFHYKGEDTHCGFLPKI